MNKNTLIQTQQQKLVQQQRLSAQQILQVKLVEMPLAELEQHVQAEVDDNPALEESGANGEELEMGFEEPGTKEEETFEMEQNQYHNMTVWEHTLAVLSHLDYHSIVGMLGTYDGEIDRVLLVRMTALLHDIGKIRTRTVGEDGRVHFIQHENVGAKMCDEILRRLKYPVEFIQKVQHLVKNHMRCKAWGNDLEHMKKKSLRKLQYEIGVHNFDTFLMLIDADNKSHAPEHCLPNQAYNIASESDELMYEGEDMFMYHLPVNGDDVMRVKNIKPGRAVRKYLDYLLKLAYNNPKLTRDEMLDKIRNLKEEHL